MFGGTMTAMTALAAWALSAPVASAQDPATAVDDARFDGQVFRPSADSEATIWTEDTHTAPDGYASARAYLQYARAPVRWKGEDGVSENLVSDLFGVDTLGAVRWRSLRMGVHVPLYFVAAGSAGDPRPGLGDIAIDLKGTVLTRDDSPIGVGVAIMGRLALPTASVDVPVGASGTGWELLAVADRELGAFTVAANLGTRGVPRATYEDLVWDDQLFARAGGGWRWNEDLGLSAELGAQTNWASGQSPAGTAVELMGGGWGWLRDGLVARGGLSVGLTRSPGAPVVRLIAGVAYEPDPKPDRDHDGVVNRRDACPDEPEDVDAYQDADGCPDPSYTIEVRLLGRGGAAVDGVVQLTGPDTITLASGDRYAAVHPGKYQVSATSRGYRTWSGPLDVAARQGEQLEIPLASDDGGLRVVAVDAAGKAIVGARVSVSGGDPMRADLGPITVPPGEHALVVSADGFVAATANVSVDPNTTREVAIVLVAKPPEPVAPSAPPRP